MNETQAQLGAAALGIIVTVAWRIIDRYLPDPNKGTNSPNAAYTRTPVSTVTPVSTATPPRPAVPPPPQTPGPPPPRRYGQP